MTPPNPDLVAEQLALADELAAGGIEMLEPQDLPGRYGRVVRAIDGVLAATDCEAVVGSGWAVWRHGYINRVTQDIDIVLPAAKIEEFLSAASISGFLVLRRVPGRWPKLQHKETGVEVDVLPEGERPGTPPDYAPTTIPSPSELGARGNRLRYIELAPLIELKLAAGRLKDKADIAALTSADPSCVGEITAHLASVHPSYKSEFGAIVEQANRDNNER